MARLKTPSPSHPTTKRSQETSLTCRLAKVRGTGRRSCTLEVCQVVVAHGNELCLSAFLPLYMIVSPPSIPSHLHTQYLSHSSPCSSFYPPIWSPLATADWSRGETRRECRQFRWLSSADRTVAVRPFVTRCVPRAPWFNTVLLGVTKAGIWSNNLHPAPCTPITDDGGGRVIVCYPGPHDSWSSAQVRSPTPLKSLMNATTLHWAF